MTSPAKHNRHNADTEKQKAGSEQVISPRVNVVCEIGRLIVHFGRELESEGERVGRRRVRHVDFVSVNQSDF